MAVKIVIVDDSALVRRSVKEMLQACDDLALVGEAECTEEGLRVIIAQHPDVVVLDIIMPGGNGLSIINSIKVLRPACKVIMLSNHSDEFIRREARMLGADHFLDKTFEFEQLVDTVRAAGCAVTNE